MSSKQESRPLLGVAPKIGDKRSFDLLLLSLGAVVAIGLRVNAAKVATQYDYETGVAKPSAEESIFNKPIFLASTYFMGKALVFPFVMHRLSGFKFDVYTRIFLLVCLGGTGGILEYSSVVYLPVSIAGMIRVGGLVTFTALGSAYLTRKSSLDLPMGISLALVVVGVVIASVHHLHAADFQPSQVLGIMLALASSVADSAEQWVSEDVLQDDTGEDVDVWVMTGICGVMGLALFVVLLVIAQLLPGNDYGSQENTLMTFQALGDSWVLTLVLIFVMTMGLVQMLTATALTKYFGVTTKESVLAFRICGIWLLAILLHFFMSDWGFGESVTPTTAAVKVIGGAAIIAGTIAYIHFRRRHDEETGKVDPEV